MLPHGERPVLRGQPKGSPLDGKLSRLAADSGGPGKPVLSLPLCAAFPYEVCSDSLGFLCASPGRRRDSGDGTEQRFWPVQGS